MVTLTRRGARRSFAVLAGCLAAAAGASPALAANDADLDQTFGVGGQALFDDPFSFPSDARGADQLERDLPIDSYVDADGDIVTLSSMPLPLFLARGEVEPFNPLFRVSRLTSAGQPDPAYSATGVPGEAVPLTGDEGILFAREIHPGPDGTVLVLSAPPTSIFRDGDRGLPIEWAVSLTRLAADGSLDTTFNDGSATRILHGGTCSYVAAAGFRPDGKVAVITADNVCRDDRGGPQFELLVFHTDGTLDEVASEPLGAIGLFGFPIVAFGTENGQVVTYVAPSPLTRGGEHQTPVVKLGPGGERDLDFGGTKDGVAVVDGVILKLITTASGAPQALSLAQVFDKERGEDVGLEWIVTRLTGAGLPDGGWGTDGEMTLPGDRPDLGSSAVAYYLGMTLDPDDRTHVIGTTIVATEPEKILRAIVTGVTGMQMIVSRLTANGALDTTWGESGERLYGADEGQTRFLLFRRFSLLLGMGTPDVHQADGKLVVPHMVIPTELLEGDVDRATRGLVPQAAAAAVRMTGTTVDPPAPPPPGPVPPTAGQATPVTGTAVKKPRTCRSRRAFTIRLRPKRARLRSAVVTVNGKRVAVSKGRRFTAQVNLRGRIPSTIRVRIVAKDRKGRTFRETRTYRTCRFNGRPLKDITLQ